MKLLEINPITRLGLFLAFSISTLLSTHIGLLIFHCIATIFLLFQERDHWTEWKKVTRPFWRYFPITGLIFFFISFLVSNRPIPIIIIDILMATIRLIIMVSVMTIYTIQSKTHDIILAIRSIWYAMGFQWRWVEDILLFFDMTIRFFPSFQEDWMQLEKSQKSLSVLPPNTLKAKAIQVAHFIPDFIILNLKKAESITRMMELRGYGKSIPRSVYPYIQFSGLDFICLFIFPLTLIGIHSIGKI
ncbi:MAG: hypothetical protein HOB40_06020 [Candidatus Marinimicrobia bacterium]|jgi:energy-coupling factor transporter transmembrane protein EcfT|nr:hypothetical protein [Candidatus Neomarinimicrobiota bacterium]MBT3501410.1 hypothetical protein [Candidatus Neomarinimicrobiota bacterium]MBT3839451.1 hypothetical protein [Candidatus Neomarinimicrobiota bacterium]MBT3998564.1 hypothetical protein [Candidatus Neomarinimicrobiota bacterium]MBT4283036.1 hypothetical protein [Candidatus Neomarinimicrobiota bacterium]